MTAYVICGSSFTTADGNTFYNPVDAVNPITGDVGCKFVKVTNNSSGNVANFNYQLSDVTYSYTITANADVGSGANATFNIGIVAPNYYLPSIVDGGQDFTVGDLITIPGTSLGGATPDNDLVIEVFSVTGNSNAIFTINNTGTSAWPLTTIGTTVAPLQSDFVQVQSTSNPSKGVYVYANVADVTVTMTPVQVVR